MKIWRLVVLVVMQQIAMSASATEEPEWILLEKQGDIELRYYEPVVQARTLMHEESKTSSGFRTLAGYIFGGNVEEQEIAMTAPVEQSMDGENSYMAFYMPAQYSLDSLPEPDDSRVTLHTLPARTVAVITFSGWAREKVVEEKTRDLLAALSARGIVPEGEALLAQYNPPWTLPWSRRNEVMVQIPAQQQGT